MKHDPVTRLHKNFEDHVHVQDGAGFSFARDLQGLPGYTEWRNFFLRVIKKARESCIPSSHAVFDHFADISKSIPVPKGGVRSYLIRDFVPGDEQLNDNQNDNRHFRIYRAPRQ